MTDFYYFLHIGSLIAWMGAFIAFGSLLLSPALVVKTSETPLLLKISNLVLKVFAPLSFVTLVTGILMIVAFPGSGDLPLWLIIKERAGGVILLVTMIWMSRKANVVRKAINNKESEAVLTKATVSFARWMLILAVLAVAIVVVASFDFQ
ncbi:MAG: hypothetical protein ACRC5C_08610 [Bacilli bacterium]